MKLIDLTGKTFGRLTVLQKSDRSDAHGHPLWDARCICGETKPLSLASIKSAHGQCPHRSRVEDITGRKFHRLTVVAMAGLNEHAQAMCVADCDCGTKGRKLLKSMLMTGKTRSCGCLRTETTVARSTTHGLKSRANPAPEYAIRLAMLSRCYNPKDVGYPGYGGRGITVCDRWRESFSNFMQDMGPRPSPELMLERKNNDAGYSPENCCWATPVAQANNTRANIYVVYQGERIALTLLCRRLGLKADKVRWRYNNGWPIERALG